MSFIRWSIAHVPFSSKMVSLKWFLFPKPSLELHPSYTIGSRSTSFPCWNRVTLTIALKPIGKTWFSGHIHKSWNRRCIGKILGLKLTPLSFSVMKEQLAPLCAGIPTDKYTAHVYRSCLAHVHCHFSNVSKRRKKSFTISLAYASGNCSRATSVLVFIKILPPPPFPLFSSSKIPSDHLFEIYSDYIYMNIIRQMEAVATF